MYLLIRHPAGIIVEAVMLANRKNRMRVIAADFPDDNAKLDAIADRAAREVVTSG